ncbi:uncharacterized protein YbjT (DUF2867 family) [Rhizobium leucaenae]|uniref:Uncharacterized protein YbjT (DUF2867 family) n=2 Tax=Rhizobium leucaenae TaxID=29450 RepID=A0A7W7EMP6_9HYPH|nr:uncharacterized protein YbjT (DUF2867 family) [Rhizobium leucaenae]
MATLSHGKALHDALVITGPEALSYREMTAAIGEVTSDSIHYDTLSDDDAMMGVSMRADRPYAEALVDIWRVREGRLTTVSDGLQQLLGRASKSFSDWIGENISYFAERTGRSR